jgi:4-alpha-glucanotransferase
MHFGRVSGILLHPTSLPSHGGIGDLGPAAYDFLAFLEAAEQGLWQVLPLAPGGFGNSPYSAISAFAGHPLLVSLERLAERGWIDPARLASLPDSTSSVDYPRVHATKLPLLHEAARNFISGRGDGDRGRFDDFRQQNQWWLDDFVLFEALRDRYHGASWNRWPRPLAQRDPGALDGARRELAGDLEERKAIQFAFFEQWRAVHQRCHQLGIKVIGDVAIFVSYDSADVWTHPDIFHLDENREPYVVAGVPPDAFSETGQRWGNPLYRWDVLRSRGYDWWMQRMRWALQTCDILRLDHFRGFESYWEIPAHEPTAVHGRWVEGPKDDLFHVLRRELGELPVIAEDLGMITAEVHALRQRLQIPGMRVLQFGFGDPGAHIYLPHRFESNTVVYTGTHDNDTTVGWWRVTAAEHERRAAAQYFGANGNDIHCAFIRAAETSIADLCVIPLQDVLGLGEEARMNTPSHPEGNWTWRFRSGMLTTEITERLRNLTELSDRHQEVLAAKQQGNRKPAEQFAA